MNPPRVAVLWCPQWPVVAAGAAVDEPVAVLHANRVVARSAAAAAAGVRLGLRRRDAQARCPEVRLVPYEPLVDRRAFHPVAEIVADSVPRIEVTAAGTLTFHTRGPARYFGGEAAMAERVLAAVDEVLGDAWRAAGPPGLGIADGRFAAQVAAQSAARRAGAGRAGTERGAGGGGAAGRVLVIEAGGSPSFLAPMPLRWLLDAGGTGPGAGGAAGAGGAVGAAVGTELVELVARLGVVTLGDLAALPEADVLARFGRPGSSAWRLAAGGDDRPVGTEEPPAGLAVVQHFDTPVQHVEAVVFTGRQLAERLVGALGGAGRVCTQFVAIAETDHGETSERVWSLSTGFTAAAMVERIRWQLDGWARLDAAALERAQDPDDPDPDLDPLAVSGVPTTGIIQLRIEPTEVRPDDGVQLGLWGGRSQADDWAQRAATRLAGLVGDEHVVVAEWRGGRHPADVHRWVPASLSSRLDPGAHRPVPPSGTSGGAGGAGASAGRRPPWPGGLPMPSPATVHAEPLPVSVVDGRGRAVTVSGRGTVSAPPAVVRRPDGDRSRISAWAGPWLVEERWWDPARHRRLARFQLLTTDGRAYLAAIERSQWWVLAVYD